MISEKEGDLRCRTPDGHEWRVESLEVAPDALGRQRRIRVIEAAAEDLEVPLRLDVFSRLRYGLLRTWPPERALRIYCEGDSVLIEYQDEWVPFERPILPFGYDHESEWKARFDPRRRTWSLERLRRLSRP